ncbi:hypothetical protein [Nannocystis bainbridge]|uniref:DUF2383 domain-containing protein n=1 Tax=Nannocystis bainbridge TaxID=2995303 RepID=A0ABT5ECN5_9BACT|nr:hypothetical protein [Nannocystis bainbridge]MDC0723621.1 hypothetical protein [Nannocystis bainbridge]
MVFDVSLPPDSQEALITLFRGEATAVEAYARALEKFAGQPEEPTLGEIAAGHREAAARLETELKRQGIVVPEGPGPWGVIFNALGSLTALVNDEVPLQMLQRGEESGVAMHEQALAAGGFSPDLLRRIRDGMDRCQRNGERLQGLRDVITTRPTRPMI